jgi:predicted RNA methylase
VIDSWSNAESNIISAIKGLAGRMAGRVVLDAGAGTGVLSMWCARIGGAARV